MNERLAIHEGGHAVVALAQGASVDRIALTEFGGVCEIAESPHTVGFALRVNLAGAIAEDIHTSGWPGPMTHGLVRNALEEIHWAEADLEAAGTDFLEGAGTDFPGGVPDDVKVAQLLRQSLYPHLEDAPANLELLVREVEELLCAHWAVVERLAQALQVSGEVGPAEVAEAWRPDS